MNGQYSAESLDSLKMKTSEQQESSRSWNNIMTHRLKNRERQRRYRASKRLETEMKMTCVADQSPIVNVEVEMNGNNRNFVAHVHCKRSWKKDARRAHACKDSDEVMAEAPQMKALHAENPPSLQNSGTYRPWVLSTYMFFTSSISFQCGSSHLRRSNNLVRLYRQLQFGD